MDRQTFENEIAAKDKEVSSSFQARIRGGSTFLHLRCRLARVNPQQTNFSFEIGGLLFSQNTLYIFVTIFLF
jgi:hypothetical protein